MYRHNYLITFYLLTVKNRRFWMFHGRLPYCLAVRRQIAFEIKTCVPYHRPIPMSVSHQSRQSNSTRHCRSDLTFQMPRAQTCFVAIVEYFRIFRSAAASAAASDLWTGWGRLVWAKVSATVTSQLRDLPADQGTRVRPSGRFPSSLTSPVGSLLLEFRNCIVLFLLVLPHQLRLVWFITSQVYYKIIHMCTCLLLISPRHSILCAILLLHPSVQIYRLRMRCTIGCWSSWTTECTAHNLGE